MRLPLESAAHALAASRGITLVATESGAVAITDSGMPQELTHRRPTAVAAASNLACVLDDAGLWCWGGGPRQAPGEPNAGPQDEPGKRWVVAYGNRILFGGGARVSPRAAGEKLVELGGVLDLTVGPYDDEKQPVAIGIELDVRTIDFDDWRAGGGVSVALTNEHGAAVLLSAGVGGQKRANHWEPIATGSARVGARGALAADNDHVSQNLGIAYKFELSFYVSVAVGLVRPRVVEITGGLATDPLALAALISLPFADLARDAGR